MACGVPLLIARTSKATGVQQGDPIEPGAWTSSIRKYCSAQEILSQLSDFELSHNKPAFRRSSHSCHLQTSRMPLLFFDAYINACCCLFTVSKMFLWQMTTPPNPHPTKYQSLWIFGQLVLWQLLKLVTFPLVCRLRYVPCSISASVSAFFVHLLQLIWRSSH